VFKKRTGLGVLPTTLSTTLVVWLDRSLKLKGFPEKKKRGKVFCPTSLTGMLLRRIVEGLQLCCTVAQLCHQKCKIVHEKNAQRTDIDEAMGEGGGDEEEDGHQKMNFFKSPECVFNPCQIELSLDRVSLSLSLYIYIYIHTYIFFRTF